MPTFQLSTILGMAVAAFGALHFAFPDQPWIGAIGSALPLILASEHPKQ